MNKKLNITEEVNNFVKVLLGILYWIIAFTYSRDWNSPTMAYILILAGIIYFGTSYYIRGSKK